MANNYKPGAHPGWSVQFEDKSWLACGHGYSMAKKAAFAYVYDSVDQARQDLDRAREDLPPIHNFYIVPAWEPLCEKLRVEIEDLRNVNSIDSLELFMATETIKTEVKKIEMMNISYAPEAPSRWEDEEKSEYGVDVLRRDFCERLYKINK